MATEGSMSSGLGNRKNNRRADVGTGTVFNEGGDKQYRKAVRSVQVGGAQGRARQIRSQSRKGRR